MSSGAPSCAFLGAGAVELATKALRRARASSGAPRLLVRWGCSMAPRPLGLPALGRGLRTHVRQLRERLPAAWDVEGEGSLLVVDVPAAADPDDVLFLVAKHPGPVAVAIGLPRCDGVDAVLRAVDEVVVVGPAVESLRRLAEQEVGEVAPRLSVVPPPRSRLSVILGGDDGQSTVVVLAVIAGVLAVAVGLGIVATALGRASDVQGRADVASLSAAKAMLDGQSLMYSPDPAARIDVAEYRARAERAAMRNADANGLRVKDVSFLGDPSLPTRVKVTALSLKADGKHDRQVVSVAEVAVASFDGALGAGDYPGPFAIRQGQRMRPDVALAFDRFNAAATAAGHPLVIVSAFRSDAEQAVLFARHPDPKWVAPPGKSLHRLATELDLGPASAYAWIDANGTRFGFLQRYSWEPWHMGYARSPGSASLGYKAQDASTGSGGSADSKTSKGSGGGDQDDAAKDDGPERATRSAVPSFVPAQYAPIIAAAAQRWSVGAALLGAQLYVESHFNPNAVSGVGAAGIAQFMPGTGAAYGLSPAERFDPSKAIPAQAHLMHDLLAKFGSVPLALAAYNAGDGAVAKCMCVPAIPETQGYVQSILALLGGAGIAAPAGLQIRLVQ